MENTKYGRRREGRWTPNTGESLGHQSQSQSLGNPPIEEEMGHWTPTCVEPMVYDEFYIAPFQVNLLRSAASSTSVKQCGLKARETQNIVALCRQAQRTRKRILGCRTSSGTARRCRITVDQMLK